MKKEQSCRTALFVALKTLFCVSKKWGGIMRNVLLSYKILETFRLHLLGEEKSVATIEAYMRSVLAFQRYCRRRTVTKSTVSAYKQRMLSNGYAPRSINAALAALNALFDFLGWQTCKVKAVRTQREMYCSENRELSRDEYERLCRAALKNGNRRLFFLLQTICGTGIRVSELAYVTVEAVRNGEVNVVCKSKIRKVFIVKALRKELLRYAADAGIAEGPVFRTRSGRPVNRSNIWRDMKGLCREAKVDPRKVFPHNLRHLFAREFYRSEKDIAALADILGHSSIETTRLYIVSTGREHRRRMEKMRLIL